MRMQQIHCHVREPRHDGVEDVQDRRHEDKGKFYGFGNAGQEAGQRGREENTGRDFLFLVCAS